MRRVLLTLLGIIILIMPVSSFAGECTDVNNSGSINLLDITYIISYLYKGGPAPDCGIGFVGTCGDVDNSGGVNLLDITRIVNYLYKGGQEPDCQSYTIPDSTIIIPESETAVIQSYDTTLGTVALDESSSYAQEVSVGDIIIGHDDEFAPNGFLKKVTSKTIQGDSVILVTEQATMTEAFETLEISETHRLSPSDITSYKLYEGSTLKTNRADDLFTVDLNCVLYDYDGNHETTDDQIRLEGEYSFTADLSAKIKIKWFQLKEFETKMETDEEVDLNLVASVQWNFPEELKVELAEFHLGAIPVAGVVILVPTLTVSAHIDGDLTVTIETGITATQELKYGFGYDNGDFYNISESTKDFIYNPPQFTAEFNFEPGVSLDASCLLYGVAGPYLSAKTGFPFQSVLSADPYGAILAFNLNAILYAGVGIECDILGLDYNHQWELYNYSIGEWIFPLYGLGNIIIDPEPDALNAPWSLIGPDNYSRNGTGDETLNDLNPGDYTITWEDVTGWITPSGEMQTLATDETITFGGTYVEEPTTGTIVIDVEPDALNAPWLLSGPDGYNNSGNGDQTLTDLNPGDYSITWEDVTGWITPSSEMQSLAAGVTVTFGGSYIETGTVTDIDGNIYQTVTIGDQVWMAENLKVTHYRNGDPIPLVTDNSTWSGLTTGAYCEYDNNPANVAVYGRLYNWYSVDDSRNIAPEGWHVPTDDEWKQLEVYLGMSQAEADTTGWRGTNNEGGNLKEAGTEHWQSPNTGATNESGFTALPGGYHDNTGDYYSMGYGTLFWSSTGSTESTLYSEYYAWCRIMAYSRSEVNRSVGNKQDGCSIRCVKDDPPTGTVTDIDGNIYQTVMIGEQEWMAENLKVTHYQNGDAIPNVTDDVSWASITTGAYCEYNNDIYNVETYGRLYDYFAVTDSRNIAPEGWHVPTDAEWKQLEMFLGMSQAEADGTGSRGTDEGGKLKEVGTTHWESPNTGATNENGLTALPGGYRKYDGSYYYGRGLYAYFWSSAGYNDSSAWIRYLYYNGSGVARYASYKRNGYSIRCVRD